MANNKHSEEFQQGFFTQLLREILRMDLQLPDRQVEKVWSFLKAFLANAQLLREVQETLGDLTMGFLIVFGVFETSPNQSTEYLEGLVCAFNQRNEGD